MDFNELRVIGNLGFGLNLGFQFCETSFSDSLNIQ